MAKLYAVKMTASQMFYVRMCMRSHVMTRLDEIQHLYRMTPKDAQDSEHIEEALSRKKREVKNLEAVMDKMMEAGSANENPYV